MSEYGSIDWYCELYDAVIECARTGRYGNYFSVRGVIIPDEKLISCKSPDELKLLLETEIAIAAMSP